MRKRKQTEIGEKKPGKSALGTRLGKGVKGSPRTPLRPGQDGVTRLQL